MFQKEGGESLTSTIESEDQGVSRRGGSRGQGDDDEDVRKEM